MTAQTVALLLERSKNQYRICEYRILVLDVQSKEERISETFNETTIGWCDWGSVAELRSGELIAKTFKMRNVHVWKIGEQNARPLSIPVEDFYGGSLSVLENVLGKEELIALAFYSNKSIGLFAIDQSKLDLVRIILLEFSPVSMLWIVSKQMLFVSDRNYNKKEIFAVRLTRIAAFPDNVTLEGRTNINVLCWCALGHHSGDEKSVVLFDANTKHLLNFQLV